MHLVPPAKPVAGRVVSSEICTKGKSHSFVRHVAIDVSGTPLAGNFLVGQSFGVIPPGVDERGKPHQVRLYSIASPTRGEDGQGNVLSTTVKRTIDEFKPQKPNDDPDAHGLFLGVCSNYLCDLKVGDEVRVSGPNGKRFILPANPEEHDYLFIATGTGIAPFRGMAMELLQNPKGPTRSKIHLVMGSPYTTDLLYDRMFRDFATGHSNFKYSTAISRECRADGSPGCYVDRMMEERIDEFALLLRNPRTLIYICGLAGMQVGIFTMLATQGLGEPYMIVKDDLAAIDPSDWTAQQIKRSVRPSHRCFLEVY
jgi:ferredoxin--NADP+ reductase